MITAHAPAKLNLSLRIRPPDSTGMHPLQSLVSTVGWHDVLSMGEADEDRLDVIAADLPTDGDNLVWKAVQAIRSDGPGARPPVNITLTKRIPTAAGLGGGSSDAAAALLAYADLVGFARDRLAGLAEGIGADVPYLLEGGLRVIEGYGERLGSRRSATDDHRIVVAVPPFELSTPAVYRQWDRLSGPEGPALSRSAVPPSLRSDDPLVNDLYPAAVSLEPLVADWRAELADRWDRPVAMSGSGPSLFAFFTDDAEAAEALAVVPAEARGAFAAAPVGHGARLIDRRS